MSLYLFVGGVLGLLLYSISAKTSSADDEFKFKSLKINKRIYIYDSVIQKYAMKYGIPTKRIKAIIMTESAGDPNARGSIGEVGLMQMTPIALSDLIANHPDWYPGAQISHLWNTDMNIKAGTSYLQLLYQRLGDLDKATQAYNAGIGRVQQGSSIGLDYVEKVLNYERSLS